MLSDMPDAPHAVRVRWKAEKQGVIVAFSAMFLLAFFAYVSFPLHKL